jgi:uncharacterized membrane protein YqiK
MTRAVTIAELGDTNVFSVDGTNNRVGIGSTQPTEKLDVSGVVVATAFTGDGTGLTGVASTDNIVTGTAATFNNNVNISGITTVGVLTAYTSVTVGTAITADAASGIVTATKFVGDGSELTGVSGFATALSSDTASILNKVFKTPVNLEVAADATIQSDAASDNIAFMREGRIHVQNGVVLTVGSGTTVLMNILSIFP